MNDILPPGRSAGVLLHVSGLPGPHGIGDIGAAARDFVDCIAAMGLTTWQILPLGPTGFGNSPYQPLSTFAGNELLIDIGELAAEGLLTSAEIATLSGLPVGEVDFARLIPAKSALLRAAAERFETAADAVARSALHAFDEQHRDWLHDYCQFRALKDRFDGLAWYDWPPAFRRRESKALRRISDEMHGDIRAYATMQFLFCRQWSGLRQHASARGVRLLGDLPIYIALDSADAWANPDLLQIDRDGVPDHVAGVPPDYFSEDGQLWGNPLYAWDTHAGDNYRWWVKRVARASHLVELVRIDHFRGFEAYWSIPAEAPDARSGRWLPGPGDAIFDAMQKALGHLPIVAEDLGVITPEVEALRDRHGLPGMTVLQFKLAEPAFDPARIAENTVCYTGTHDNDTTLGWFRGSPDDNRSSEEIARTRQSVLARTGGTEASVVGDIVRLALECPARLAIAPLQDYLGLGSEARFNTPGTASGNWRWRCIASQPDDAVVRRVRRDIDRAGRLPATTI